MKAPQPTQTPAQPVREQLPLPLPRVCHQTHYVRARLKAVRDRLDARAITIEGADAASIDRAARSEQLTGHLQGGTR